MWAYGAAIALTACAHRPPAAPDPVIPHQAEALGIVWRTYARAEAPPRVRWVSGAGLDCNGPSGASGFVMWGVGCVDGVAWYGVIQVASWPDVPISRTAFAHELLHAALLHDSNDDPTHARPELWGPGGALDRATAALAAAGY
jgi:hypothetical protein